MDSIVSYLRISNSIGQNNNPSKYQQLLTLGLSMLKLTIEESKIINIINTTIKEIERGNYIEMRGSLMDSYIKKTIINIEKVELLLNEFLLKGNKISQIKNYLFNDTFGSLNQFKIELMNRFSCEECQIITHDKITLDA